MTDNGFKNALTARIVAFLTEIGLEVEVSPVGDETFLPGILVRGGVLLVDEERLKYPGDLLHEAGHLAVMAAERRGRAGADAGKSAGEELMAIAWSYAALVHLGLEPSVVFHADGYKGGSASLIENFTSGRHFGVPGLQWLGLTADERTAKETGAEPYPRMIRWLRE